MTLDGKYGIIILAAGQSARLGRPKQLIKYRNKTLLKHIADEAFASVGEKLLIVLGAYKELLTAELDEQNVNLIYNEDWQSGMASSVVSGLSGLLAIYPDIDGVIFTVCDQPFVSSQLFNVLIAKHQQTNSGIVASYYNDTAGVPALFSKKYFNELLTLSGEEGARKLFKLHKEDLQQVNFPEGAIDIDTEDDVLKLK